MQDILIAENSAQVALVKLIGSLNACGKKLMSRKCLIEKLPGEVDVVESAGDSMSRLRIGVGFHALDTIVGHLLGEVLKLKNKLNFNSKTLFNSKLTV